MTVDKSNLSLDLVIKILVGFFHIVKKIARGKDMLINEAKELYVSRSAYLTNSGHTLPEFGI